MCILIVHTGVYMYFCISSPGPPTAQTAQSIRNERYHKRRHLSRGKCLSGGGLEWKPHIHFMKAIRKNNNYQNEIISWRPTSLNTGRIANNFRVSDFVRKLQCDSRSVPTRSVPSADRDLDSSVIKRRCRTQIEFCGQSVVDLCAGKIE